MGFLSVYEGTHRVVIDEERGYWAELSDYISQGAKEEAERCLSRIVMVRGEATPSPDVARYRQQTVVAAIKSWNLDDDNGVVWPIDLKHVQMLPASIFDLIWAEVDGKNEDLTPQEERQFPVEDLGSDPNGDGGSAESVDLPASA